jgi:hypothetical protein
VVSLAFFRQKQPSGGRRHVLVHYHFFKNAGSTIEFILRENFAERFAHFDGPDHNAVLGGQDLIDFLDRNPRIVAVTSHHLRLPKPSHERYCFYDILFLRNPLARLFSTYEFYRRAETGQDPLSMAAKSRTVADFFRLLVSEYPRHAMNAQVGLLANGGRSVPAAADLATATHIAFDASMLGAAELFDESSVVGEHTLQQTFKRIDFSYVAQNVSLGHVASHEQQLRRMKEACGNAMFESLLENNQLDLALHEAALEEVRRRFQQVPRASDRLDRLQQKCKQREEAAAASVIAANHPYQFAAYANASLN